MNPISPTKIAGKSSSKALPTAAEMKKAKRNARISQLLGISLLAGMAYPFRENITSLFYGNKITNIQPKVADITDTPDTISTITNGLLSINRVLVLAALVVYARFEYKNYKLIADIKLKANSAERGASDAESFVKKGLLFPNAIQASSERTEQAIQNLKDCSSSWDEAFQNAGLAKEIYASSNLCGFVSKTVLSRYEARAKLAGDNAVNSYVSARDTHKIKGYKVPEGLIDSDT